MLKDRAVTKPRGSKIRLNIPERERERLFQHKELSDLEGTYLSASPTSNPISENGIPVSGAINLESKESSFLGHI